ncbi:antibiotic biosynthesis monooxygenase [Pokkaliibacter plantistimulans]|nr:antibiotic biosynthesis monooxygenase [Pokkaliibacter plantistimulans]
MMNEQDVVTLIVRHRIKPGVDLAYEQWLRRTTQVAASYPGHLGVNVIRDLDRFVCVLRFCGTTELQSWLDSSDRKQLIDEVMPLLVEGDQFEVDGAREFWFTPGQILPPPRWKQACITFLVILPLSMLVPLLWRPAFQQWPWLGGFVPSNVVITLSIVLLVVYFFMPRVTALFSAWLEGRSRT